MEEYDEIKVPVTCSIPLNILKEFDSVIREKRGSKRGNRSGFITKLMKLYIDKEKNFKQKNIK